MVKFAEFGVEAWLNRWEKQARYDISQSTIASMTLTELFQLTGDDLPSFLAAATQMPENYGWIEGSPDFKTAVAKLYQQLSPTNILQTNGATGANLLAYSALIEPGDHVIAEYPTYQQLYDGPKALGATVDFWHLHPETNWQPDLTELRRLLRPNTKLICLNNANNPTGTVLSRDTLTAVVQLAARVGAYVLVDEVYQPFAAPQVVPIVDLYERGISTNSLSKTYSLPGLRIGWLASPDQHLIKQVRKLRDYTMICGGVLNDQFATYALQHRETILARNRALIQANYAYYQNWLQQEPLLSLQQPALVSTSFPRLAINEPTQAFCLKLLKATGVLLVPGEAFGQPGYVRLGYCAPQATLQAGLTRLSYFLHHPSV